MTLVEAMPVGREFRATEVANLLYPGCRKLNTEGAYRNAAAATAARLIRCTNRVQEVAHGVFYIDPDYRPISP